MLNPDRQHAAAAQHGPRRAQLLESAALRREIPLSIATSLAYYLVGLRCARRIPQLRSEQGARDRLNGP